MKTWGTVEENGLENALVEQQQEVGGNGQCSQFADGTESLFTSLLNVRDMMGKTEFIVQGDTKVFMMLYYLYWFIIDVYGSVGDSDFAVDARCENQFLCFGYIKLQVVVLTPSEEMGEGVLVNQNRVIVTEECEYGSVV